MPLYEFRCPKCLERREVVQPFGVDSPLCPQCHQEMERLISPPAMIKIDGIPLKYKSYGVTPLKSWEQR